MTGRCIAQFISITATIVKS